ncbi:hypothetical protein [Streptomyces sp. UG1]|uniref:hypothetical protein n=1 Tax=Streptomyces sp. UG1 TaxID=3417652 RepID=UPI003CF6A9B0
MKFRHLRHAEAAGRRTLGVAATAGALFLLPVAPAQAQSPAHTACVVSPGYETNTVTVTCKGGPGQFRVRAECVAPSGLGRLVTGPWTQIPGTSKVKCPVGTKLVDGSYQLDPAAS